MTPSELWVDGLIRRQIPLLLRRCKNAASLSWLLPSAGDIRQSFAAFLVLGRLIQQTNRMAESIVLEPKQYAITVDFLPFHALDRVLVVDIALFLNNSYASYLS